MRVTVRRAAAFAAGLWCLVIAVQWAEFEWSRRRVADEFRKPFESSSHWLPGDYGANFTREARRHGWTHRGAFRVRREGATLHIATIVTRDVLWGGVVRRAYVDHLTLDREIF